MAEGKGRATLDEITIRPYRPADRAAVREICRRTAFRNLGSDRFFEDGEVHADYWTRYYTDFRAQECRVVVRGDRIVGYFFGCSDHGHYERTMALRILPWCLARVLWRLGTGRYGPQSRAYVRHMLLTGPREAPPINHAAFPAHYHCNLLREVYGLQLYSRLTLEFLDLLEAKGVHALHGHITEPAESGSWNRFAERFKASLDQASLKAGAAHQRSCLTAEVPTTLFRAVTGDARPMVNRVWGVQVRDYRDWMRFVRDTYRL